MTKLTLPDGPRKTVQDFIRAYEDREAILKKFEDPANQTFFENFELDRFDRAINDNAIDLIGEIPVSSRRAAASGRLRRVAKFLVLGMTGSSAFGWCVECHLRVSCFASVFARRGNFLVSTARHES